MKSLGLDLCASHKNWLKFETFRKPVDFPFIWPTVSFQSNTKASQQEWVTLRQRQHPHLLSHRAPPQQHPGLLAGFHSAAPQGGPPHTHTHWKLLYGPGCSGALRCHRWANWFLAVWSTAENRKKTHTRFLQHFLQRFSVRSYGCFAAN